MAFEEGQKGANEHEVVLEGIPGSPGLALGTAIVLDRRTGVVRRHVPNHQIDEEVERFDRAVELAAKSLAEAAERTRASRAESSILEAYVMMVRDETLHDEVERCIRIDRLCAEWALTVATDEIAGKLSQAADSYLAERSHDIQFVGQSVLRALAGRAEPVALLTGGREPAVLVARDLSPAETATLNKDNVLAIVTEVGTRTSHTAILARSLEIPAVVGVAGALARIGDGDMVLVDGLRGRVTLAPSVEARANAQHRAEKYRDTQKARLLLRDRPVLTRCGQAISLKGNIELPGEAVLALDQGAQGIGLYRTEFLYVNRKDLPSEDEQYETYRRVLEAVLPLPVTLRTFDIGGDKFVSSMQVPGDINPALGLRAVRLGLARRDLFLTQLRAMVRASLHGPLRIMIPMIASVGELREVKFLLERAVKEVDAAGQARAPHVPLGIMVEVPSAAILADRLAPESAFMSIGTNDLVQYALAVDRSSPELAYLASFFDPAILRLIRHVIEAGVNHNRPVFVCGAMASDPLAAVLLVGMGLRELSLEASSISDVRAGLESITVAEAEAAAEQAKECSTASEIEDLLRDAFGDRVSSSTESG
ncbi:MAG TPA: phosphoenolpyruvate--protein phosphotransferase [Polyangiaceae bacterium]|nr:phosphoenolpyruvate--protein phosphotransferase [Polyangiaceae bacterium]